MDKERNLEKRNKINRRLPFILYYLFFILPSIALAFPGDVRGFETLFFQTFDILNPIMSGIAFLLFFWGVGRFILAAGNEKELASGRQFMIWGIVGLFVLISFTGIIKFLSQQFGFSTPTTWFITLPT